MIAAITLASTAHPALLRAGRECPKTPLVEAKTMPNTDEPANSSGYRSHAYYLNTQEHHERLKAAWWATREAEAESASPSLNALVARLFEDEAARLEQKYNNGEAFPAAPKNARGVNPTATSRQGRFMSETWSERRQKD